MQEEERRTRTAKIAVHANIDATSLHGDAKLAVERRHTGLIRRARNLGQQRGGQGGSDYRPT